MPLLTSPIDGSPMKQINRYGIEIDVCPTTGGVWLDKGELEKIIAMIQQAAAQEQANIAQMHEQSAPPPKQYEEYKDKHYKKGKRKKSGILDDVLDIFDF